VTAEALSASGRRVASASAPVGGASRVTKTIALSGSTAAGQLVATVLSRRPHGTRFALAGGGTDMGIADAARGIVDAGLVDRPLGPSDPPGLVLTPLTPALAFVTRGPPREELGRVLRWIAHSVTTWKLGS
jgi:hypothetical protein